MFSNCPYVFTARPGDSQEMVIAKTFLLWSWCQIVARARQLWFGESRKRFFFLEKGYA